MNYSALIADDDRSDRRIICNILQREFHLPCIQVENGREAIYALQKIDHTKISVVFLDLDMPVMGGIETLKQINHDYPDMPVIILTASDNIKDAIEVMQMDAYDFLTKPVDVEKLNYSIRRVLNSSPTLKRRTLSKKNAPEFIFMT